MNIICTIIKTNIFYIFIIFVLNNGGYTVAYFMLTIDINRGIKLYLNMCGMFW